MFVGLFLHKKILVVRVHGSNKSREALAHIFGFNISKIWVMRSGGGSWLQKQCKSTKSVNSKIKKPPNVAAIPIPLLMERNWNLVKTRSGVGHGQKFAYTIPIHGSILTEFLVFRFLLLILLNFLNLFSRLFVFILLICCSIANWPRQNHPFSTIPTFLMDFYVELRFNPTYIVKIFFNLIF
jgi:hypothetical protein